MSLSYAARLTQNVDYGECGLPEVEDTNRVKSRELAKLVRLLERPSHLVVHTGAGVSTSCGIRDFRGPRGVWTREKAGLGLALLPGDVPFAEASPSLTHMAILGLVRAGRCSFVVSQNVDGLHLRSGLAPEKLAELHGNIFQERCADCGKEFFRNFDVGGCGFKRTPRQCGECGGDLFDMVLDWEDQLPERHFSLARRHSLLANVSLALGTSMRVHPAATIPLLTADKTQRKHANLSGVERVEEDFGEIVDPATCKKLLSKNGVFAIINLQPTPHDQEAAVRVHGRCDRVMMEVMRRLRIPIPDFVRMETVYLRQSSDRRLLVSTDVFVGNLLFARAVSVALPDGAVLRLTDECQRFEFDCSAVPVGSQVSVHVVLNGNATLSELRMQHTMSEGESVTQQEFEMVRKTFPFDENEDAWLEKDDPPSAAVVDNEPQNKRIKEESK